MQNIINSINALNLGINKSQAEKLYHFYKLVVEENTKINLTAITEYHDFIQKHYVDSLSLCLLKDESPDAVCLLESPNSKVLDLGTGGGFPGIPLAIAYPKTAFTLLDSLQKRIRFLQSSVAKLSLSNVEATHGRAEDFAHQKKYREQFDLCVSRAVANLSTLTEYALPFVKVGGYFISYKGADAAEEIHEAEYAVECLGGQIAHIGQFILPIPEAAENTDSSNDPKKSTALSTDESNPMEIRRTLVVIKKIKSSDNKYPRKAGVPSKKPLRQV